MTGVTQKNMNTLFFTSEINLKKGEFQQKIQEISPFSEFFHRFHSRLVNHFSSWNHSIKKNIKIS